MQRSISRILLIALALVSCAKDNKPKETDPELPRQELLDRVNFYCEQSRAMYEDDLNIQKCDGTLFTGIHGLLCDYVTITQFEKDQTGQLFRTPTHDCFEKGKSKAGFSRDMASGAQLFSAVRPQEEAFIQRIVDYGSANDWVVCEAIDTPTLIGRCLMSPKIISRWYDLLDGTQTALELTDDESQLLDLIPVKTGFVAHLDMVSAMTDWALYNGINDSSLKAIKKQAERVPENLLFTALYGVFHDPAILSRVSRELLDMFPADRLPNNHQDWCAHHIWERDRIEDGEVSANWQPCPDKPFEEYSGTDFIQTAWVLLQ